MTTRGLCKILLSPACHQELAKRSSVRDSVWEIAANDSTITAFNELMANKTGDVKAPCENQLAKPEQKNSNIKKLADYKAGGKEQWETFEAAFNREINSLGVAFENFTDSYHHSYRYDPLMSAITFIKE